MKPWKVSLIAFGITLLAGLVIGLVAFELIPSREMTPFERGERLGNGLAPLSFVVAGVAYLIAWRRQEKKKS